MSKPDEPQHPENAIDTIKSLIVAFVLAMTFRAFVTEGFVIPTGSMAPTLMGQHYRLVADQTGWEYPVGVDPELIAEAISAKPKTSLEGRLDALSDPMLGADHRGSAYAAERRPSLRKGDRILVHKSLYPFNSPDRFDVIVFKNPTNPNGADGNYIKRLVGLPGESVWLIDGDVFVTDADRAEEWDSYSIRRKPLHVQRTVWQPVHRSDYIPREPDALGPAFQGPPWSSGSDDWSINGERAYRCDTGDRTMLEWSNHINSINDWASYNTIRRGGDGPVYVSDVRVAGTIVPDEAGLTTTFELTVNDHVFQTTLSDSTARLRMRSVDWNELEEHAVWVQENEPVEIETLVPGEPTRVEFWHYDQQMLLFVNGDLVDRLEYEWSPLERLPFATNQRRDSGDIRRDLSEMAEYNPAKAPVINWFFEGSPLSLYRVEVDRDLYYRRVRQSPTVRAIRPTLEKHMNIVGPDLWGFGCHPDNLAILGDEHYYLLGDNSRRSSDSRLWGNPHPLVATQVDDSPFVVHESLLLGKAWVVYFPSPIPASPLGRGVIPDFGRLRFIR